MTHSLPSGAGLSALVLLTAACTTTPPAPDTSAPVETRPTEQARPSAPNSIPAPVAAPKRPAPGPTAAPLAAPPAPPAPPSVYGGPLQGRALVQELLPPTVRRDRAGWAVDIAGAFAALRLPATAENFCAAMAVIEQESSFQADPEVPGLARIAWREIEARRESHHIPKLALDAALAKPSPDGRSYRQRIDSLRTERQMSLLYTDIIDEVPGGKTLLAGYNPVRTGGPMQVSVAFARDHVREKPYGATLVRDLGGDLREAVFTRRGGLYFGIAHLLDYPAPYRDIVYRFADYNAGRYSSRNAAFQQALSRLTGLAMDLDGDLLNYENGAPSGKESATQQAARRLASRLRLSPGEIDASLLLEKSEAFARTALYQKVLTLADEAAGQRQPRELMPRIDLKSPKIRSKITTAWFAERVHGRYQLCLQRAANLPSH